MEEKRLRLAAVDTEAELENEVMEEKRLRLATVDAVEGLQYSPIEKLFYEHVYSRVSPFIAAGYAVKDCSYQDGKLKVELYKSRPLV